MILSKEKQYQIATAGAALLAGALVKTLLTAGWRGIANSEPPLNPENPEVSWRDALTWTIASSVVIGVAGLMARKGVSTFIERPFGGSEPLV